MTLCCAAPRHAELCKQDGEAKGILLARVSFHMDYSASPIRFSEYCCCCCRRIFSFALLFHLLLVLLGAAYPFKTTTTKAKRKTKTKTYRHQMGLVIGGQSGCGSFATRRRNAECCSRAIVVVVDVVSFVCCRSDKRETGVVEWTGRDEINDVKVGSERRVDATASVVRQATSECFLHPPTHFAVFVVLWCA
jgi:hypothetical protein